MIDLAAGRSPHIAAFIQERLPLEPAPGIPEIRLHRAGPRSGLQRLAEADPDFGSPYWTRPWGGGLALARHVLDHPGLVAGKRVLDLGAGSGLVAIAAALAGARTVQAADVDPYAVVAAGLNAAANGVAIGTVCGDLTTEGPPDAELILVGDLFYDEVLAARMTLFLERCVAGGVKVLIGDPFRAFLPNERLRILGAYRVADYGDPGGSTRDAAVFEFA